MVERGAPWVAGADQVRIDQLFTQPARPRVTLIDSEACLAKNPSTADHRVGAAGGRSARPASRLAGRRLVRHPTPAGATTGRLTLTLSPDVLALGRADRLACVRRDSQLATLDTRAQGNLPEVDDAPCVKKPCGGRGLRLWREGHPPGSPAPARLESVGRRRGGACSVAPAYIAEAVTQSTVGPVDRTAAEADRNDLVDLR